LDDRRRDGGTNSTLRTKEQGTHLTLNEHDVDDDITIFVAVLQSPTTVLRAGHISFLFYHLTKVPSRF